MNHQAEVDGGVRDRVPRLITRDNRELEEAIEIVTAATSFSV